jgi:hypothetical protein
MGVCVGSLGKKVKHCAAERREVKSFLLQYIVVCQQKNARYGVQFGRDIFFSGLRTLMVPGYLILDAG